MAILSNINDKFAVDSTGAIQFNGQAGTSGYVLKSNGNAAPTWVDASTVIGGPYLPLSGGTLTGATATASGISFTVGGVLNGTSATFTGKVGIGTTTPEEKMVVMGNIGFGAGGYNGGVFANNNDSVTGVDSNWGLEVQRTANTDDYNTRLKYYPTNGSLRKAGIWNSRDDNFTIYSDDDTVPSVIIPTGNVGIGTTAPGYKLTVAGEIALDSYLRHNGDSNTFFGFSGNDEIKFRTAGSDRIFINSSGNVGIGTNSPNRPLQVIGQVAIANAVEASSTGALLFSCDSTSNKIYSRTVQNVTGSHPIDFIQTTTTVMRIDSSGNVGIGTTDIEETLTIAKHDGGDGTIVGLRSDASFSQFELVTKDSQVSWGLQTIGARNMYFTTNGSERMRIDSSGNVGIGVTPWVSTLPNTVIDINPVASIWGYANSVYLNSNAYYNNGWLYKSTASAGVLQVDGNILRFRAAASGTADAGIAFDVPFIVDSTGNVGIGTTSPSGPFHVKVGTSTPLIVASSSYCNNVGIRTTTPTASLQVKGNVSYSYNNYTNVANTWINVINFSGYPAGLYQISIIKKTNASTYITAIVKWSATAGTVVSTIASNQLGITFSGTQLQAISGIATGTLMSANLQCLVTNEDFCS